MHIIMYEINYIFIEYYCSIVIFDLIVSIVLYLIIGNKLRAFTIDVRFFKKVNYSAGINSCSLNILKLFIINMCMCVCSAYN